MIQYIDQVENLKGKKVLLRLDLNVPIQDGVVTDTYRMERAIQTVDFLRRKEAQVIIISHCEGKESQSLLPMWNYLNGFFSVDFCPTYFTPEAVHKLLEMKDKSVLMFENLRINPGEKENNIEFAKQLAQTADIYVNDAFAVSHRKHASVALVPEFLPHYGGLLMREEIENLQKVFSPKHPFVFILGGAKFETKLPLIKKYLESSDTVFVAGALANDIYKAKGYEIGQSLFSDGDFGIKEMLVNEKFSVPVDVTVKNIDGEVSFKKPSEIKDNETIVDAGPETIEQLKNILATAETIVWNGPLGIFEKGFSDKTEKLAELVAERTQVGATSIIGGGDTLASIQKLGLENKFTFVSTGGGAMLDFLVNETLPGIEALKQK